MLKFAIVFSCGWGDNDAPNSTRVSSFFTGLSYCRAVGASSSTVKSRDALITRHYAHHEANLYYLLNSVIGSCP